MIKTFRGILGDGDQAKIRLSTKNGKIGYRITRLDIIPAEIAAGGGEHTCKVTKVALTTIDNNVDFSDGNLLAVAVAKNSTSVHLYGVEFLSIFDREMFNQDIYVSHHDNDGSRALNYYIELETINMTDNAAAVSTLRDIRLNPQVGA